MIELHIKYFNLLLSVYILFKVLFLFIKSDSNIYFQSQPKDDEIIFGPKDFSYNTKSEITSNEVKYEEKENVDLAKKLVDKFTLVDSEELLQAFRDKKLAKVEEEETKHFRLFMSGAKGLDKSCETIDS